MNHGVGGQPYWSLFWREHHRHAFAFHRRFFLDLGEFEQLFFDHLQHAFAFLGVLHFAPLEHHIDQHLVMMFEEFLGLVDLGLNVVDIGLGVKPNFLQLLLMGLGLFFLLLLLLKFELAEVYDLADGWFFERRDFDEILAGLARHFHGLRGRDDAHLLPVGADEADRTDANVFVDSGLGFSMVSTITIKWRRQSVVLLSLDMVAPRADPVSTRKSMNVPRHISSA